MINWFQDNFFVVSLIALWFFSSRCWVSNGFNKLLHGTFSPIWEKYFSYLRKAFHPFVEGNAMTRCYRSNKSSVNWSIDFSPNGVWLNDSASLFPQKKKESEYPNLSNFHNAMTGWLFSTDNEQQQRGFQFQHCIIRIETSIFCTFSDEDKFCM